MSNSEFIQSLGDWKGYCVSALEKQGKSVIIRLAEDLDRPLICDRCGKETSARYDSYERRVRELPLFDYTHVWLVFRRVRVMCRECGPQLERLPWLSAYSRVTRRLAVNVAILCKAMSVKHVSAFYRLDWDAVKRIDELALESELGPINLDGVEQMLMDEFAIEKGHRYATVIIDALTKRVLWVGRGRSRESVRPFFELLGPERCTKIKAVGMDMNTAYDLEVQAWCPNAEVVYDLFHVVAKYGREVIDRVRVDEANRLRADKKARQLVKRSRWLLLRNRENVTEHADNVRLRELLAANESLMTVYVLKDDLKELWFYRREAWAMRFWEGWLARAMESGIQPLIVFAKRLKLYLPGILSHCRWPLNTSVLEGINNKIKVIKRVAYGFRDDKYFFLKIRGAFPGKS